VKLPTRRLAVVLVFALVLGLGSQWQRFDEYGERRYWASPERKSMAMDSAVLRRFRTGDLIFRRGYGGISDLIARYGQTGPRDVSHVGLILRDSNSVLRVAHAISNATRGYDGVVVEDFAAFIGTGVSGKGCIVRLGEVSERQERLIRRAVRSMQAQGLRFDGRWDWEDAGAVFCSELVVRVLSDSAGVFKQPVQRDSLQRLHLDLRALYGHRQAVVVWDAGG
jgi:hypothetical protein